MPLAAVTVGGKVTAAIENADRAAINRTTQLMTPSSAVNGTIGTYGAVTFSTASTVSLNGCFTADFDIYEIFIDIPTVSANNQINMLLRLSGTDSVTGYDLQVGQASNATQTVGQTLNSSTGWQISATSSAKHVMKITLFRPALTASTDGLLSAFSTLNPMTAASTTAKAEKGLQHRPTTAYDGFTLTTSTGTATGSVRVYGVV